MENKTASVEEGSVVIAPKTERLLRRIIVIGWILIAIKSALVWWACDYYALPFHPLWIVGPTVAFGALCTGVYLYAKR